MVETDNISSVKDGRDLFDCAPWFPPPAPPEDPTRPAFLQETRGRYIARLEEKLAKLKGTTKEPTPNDLMAAMEKLWKASNELLASTGSLYNCADEEGYSSDEANMSTSAYTRKFHPERVALSVEEKAKLMDHDILTKHSTFPDDKPPRPLLMGWIPIDYDEEDSPVATDEEDDPDLFRKSTRRIKKRSTRKMRRTIKSPVTPTSPSIPEIQEGPGPVPSPILPKAPSPVPTPWPGEEPEEPDDPVAPLPPRSPRSPSPRPEKTDDQKFYRDKSFIA